MTAYPALAGRHVLLVDDNPLNQKLGEYVLQRLGLRVTQAANGMEALQHLRTAQFDAVLMDCQMPIMDGYEATRQLRRADSGSLNPHVPVIALTASALPGDLDRCLAAGMNAHVTKPLDTVRLAEVLMAALRAPQEPGLPPAPR